jgi:hypothetical protein
MCRAFAFLHHLFLTNKFGSLTLTPLYNYVCTYTKVVLMTFNKLHELELWTYVKAI